MKKGRRRQGVTVFLFFSHTASHPEAHTASRRDAAVLCGGHTARRCVCRLWKEGLGGADFGNRPSRGRIIIPFKADQEDLLEFLECAGG